MTLLLLVRHGTTDAVGQIIAGQLPGYLLNEIGTAEAASVGQSLAGIELTAVYSSPLERAAQTAAQIAAPHGLEVEIRDTLSDIDFGDWNARPLAELSAVPAFQRFNAHRALGRIPNGERISAVQGRMVDTLAQIVETHPDGVVAVVSHGDPIRLAIAFYIGLAVDHVQRLEIGTASVSALELTDRDAKLFTLNWRGAVKFVLP